MHYYEKRKRIFYFKIIFIVSFFFFWAKKIEIKKFATAKKKNKKSNKNTKRIISSFIVLKFSKKFYEKLGFIYKSELGRFIARVNNLLNHCQQKNISQDLKNIIKKIIKIS